MKSNNKGFSLVELIAVIVVLSIIISASVSIFLNVRNSSLNGQYNNLVNYLETKASEFASKTNITTISVGDLITEGYVNPDDETDIYDPRNGKSMNCYLLKSEYSNGSYESKLIIDENQIEGDKCKEYEKTEDTRICKYNENEICEVFDVNTWFNDENIKLGVTNNFTNANYSWRSYNGNSSTEETLIIKTKIGDVKNDYYTCSINHSDGLSEASSKIKIDRENPKIISFDKESGSELMVERKVSITATDGNGSGIYGYSYVLSKDDCTIDKSNYKDSNTLVISKNGEYKYCVMDNAGNVTSSEVDVTKNIDDKPPVISTILPQKIYIKDNYTLDKYFSVECPKTGCKSITYSINSTKDLDFGNHTVSTTAIANNKNETSLSGIISVYPKISPNNINKVYVEEDKKVIDFFDVLCDDERCEITCNYENTKDLQIGTYEVSCSVNVNVDGTDFTSSAKKNINVTPKVPSTPKVVAKINNANGKDYSFGSWTNNSLYFILKPSEENDTIDKYQVYVGSSNSVWKEINATNNEASFTYTKEGETNIFIKACYDNNCSEKTAPYAIKIDKTAPTCSLDISSRYVTFYSKSSDVKSYGISNSASASYGTTSLRTRAKTFYGHVLDKAGNTGRCQLEVVSTSSRKNEYYESYDCGYYEESCRYVCYYWASDDEIKNGCEVSSAYQSDYETCWRWHDSDNCSSTFPYLDTSGTSCSGSVWVSKTCYETVTETEYYCKRGYIQLNNSYCYR